MHEVCTVVKFYKINALEQGGLWAWSASALKLYSRITQLCTKKVQMHLTSGVLQKYTVYMYQKSANALASCVIQK